MAGYAQDQFDKIMSYIAAGKRDSSRLVAGGQRDVSEENANGLFIQPTILADVDSSPRLAPAEIFGPLLVAMPFENEQRALHLANDSIYGLAASLWTADLSRAHRMAAQLDAGMVFVNR